jgi:hypothetical protein
VEIKHGVRFLLSESSRTQKIPVEKMKPMSAVQRLRRLFLDPLLGVIALVGVFAPFAREMFSPDTLKNGTLSVGVSHAAVAEKLFLAVGMLCIIFIIALRERPENVCRHLAALSLVRIVFLTGATIAIGLAAFDACTAYHGAALDNGGSCFCWLTGALSGAGAFLAGIICLTGRALTALLCDVVRVLIGLFIAFDRLSKVASERLAHVFYPGIASGSRLARRIAGRAPPVFA